MRKLLRVLRRGLACLCVSAVLWAWIFTLVTDASPAQKIVLFANLKEGRWHELAAALEKDAPEGIRFVQAHPFSYALMNSDSLRQADLYVMTPAQALEFADWIDPEKRMLLYSAGTASGAAVSFLDYAERPGEDWYLYFGVSGLHAGGLDHAAESVAERLLALP